MMLERLLPTSARLADMHSFTVSRTRILCISFSWCGSVTLSVLLMTKVFALVERISLERSSRARRQVVHGIITKFAKLSDHNNK